MNRFLWPLIGFVVLVVLLAVGLNLNPRDVPSPLVGKPAPAFALPRLDAPDKAFSPRRDEGQGLAAQRLGLVVRLLPPGTSDPGRTRQAQGDHRWSASTTRRCAATAQSTATSSRRRRARRWSSSAPPAGCKRHGDPYTLSVLDLDGRVGIDYGVYGVPETYVIDRAGIIRMKHTGPITPDVFAGKILPLLAELAQ
jgi:cytochrome c biogenesis protein CcmG/thiol:disulfide interchange protein DsbE